MSSVLIILAALQGFHASRLQCNAIADSLYMNAFHEAWNTSEPIHLDSDRKAIYDWHLACKKPVIKRGN